LVRAGGRKKRATAEEGGEGKKEGKRKTFSPLLSWRVKGDATHIQKKEKGKKKEKEEKDSGGWRRCHKRKKRRSIFVPTLFGREGGGNVHESGGGGRRGKKKGRGLSLSLLPNKRKEKAGKMK